MYPAPCATACRDVLTETESGEEQFAAHVKRVKLQKCTDIGFVSLTTHIRTVLVRCQLQRGRLKPRCLATLLVRTLPVSALSGPGEFDKFARHQKTFAV